MLLLSHRIATGEADTTFSTVCSTPLHTPSSPALYVALEARLLPMRASLALDGAHARRQLCRHEQSVIACWLLLGYNYTTE